MRQDQRDEGGFTLIEVMTVVMIIAVLIAILIPNFLQARRPADDRAAQRILRDSLTSARAAVTEEDSTGPDSSTLTDLEPALEFVDASTSAEAKARQVSVESGTTGGSWYVILASHSVSGRCFAVLERAREASAFQRTETADCRADQFDPNLGWSNSWP